MPTAEEFCRCTCICLDYNRCESPYSDCSSEVSYQSFSPPISRDAFCCCRWIRLRPTRVSGLPGPARLAFQTVGP